MTTHRAAHDGEDLVPGKAVELELVGAVAVGVLARLASAPGLAVEQDGRAGLGDEEEVEDLNEAAEDQLDPEDPAPVQGSLDEAADDRADDRASDTRQDWERSAGRGCGSARGLPGGAHEQGDAPTKAMAHCWSSGSHMSATMPSVTDPPALERPPRKRPQTIEAKLGARAQGSWKTGEGSRDGARRESASSRTHKWSGPGDGRTVDQHETRLHDRPAPELLTRRSPELAAQTVHDEEDHLAGEGLGIGAGQRRVGGWAEGNRRGANAPVRPGPSAA